MKIFLVTFSRGSNHCYDEEIRIFFSNSLEEATSQANRYRAKYLVGWGMDVEEFSEIEKDEYNSVYFSCHYS